MNVEQSDVGRRVTGQKNSAGFAGRVRLAAEAQWGVAWPSLPSPRILVALSGGPDSTALLLALHEAMPEALIGAAHFHHGLRGSDADADASYCAEMCARLGVPLAICLGKISPSGRSPQDAARTDRYEFLSDTADQWEANGLAVAHTADDQAETVLGRVLRGTSVDGLAGIPPVRRLSERLAIIRPLLELSRADVNAYCASFSVIPREDPTNRGVKYVRSRLRQRMPEIAREFNPRLADSLRRLSDNARIDSDYLTAKAQELWEECVVSTRSGEQVTLTADPLALAHSALTRRVLLRAIRAIYPHTMVVEREQAMTSGFVAALGRVLLDRRGAVTLPGGVQARLQQKRTILALTLPKETDTALAK